MLERQSDYIFSKAHEHTWKFCAVLILQLPAQMGSVIAPLLSYKSHNEIKSKSDAMMNICQHPTISVGTPFSNPARSIGCLQQVFEMS
jgi:hypothetical protein